MKTERSSGAFRWSHGKGEMPSAKVTGWAATKTSLLWISFSTRKPSSSYLLGLLRNLPSFKVPRNLLQKCTIRNFEPSLAFPKISLWRWWPRLVSNSSGLKPPECWNYIWAQPSWLWLWTGSGAAYLGSMQHPSSHNWQLSSAKKSPRWFQKHHILH